MISIVIGNLISLLASMIMVVTGVLRKKKQILYVQTIQIGLFALSNIVLGSISGGIANIIGCIRNILCYKNKLDFKMKLIITSTIFILTILFNNLGFIGLIPLIITILYVWFMNVKDVIKFKILIIFTMILWAIHDFYIKSYVSFLFNIATIITNIFSIFVITKKTQKNE